jgi:hypothetical protein
VSEGLSSLVAVPPGVEGRLWRVGSLFQVKPPLAWESCLGRGRVWDDHSHPVPSRTFRAKQLARDTNDTMSFFGC